ncbi:MAG: hypothetical protein KGN16_25980 [Burkholderiales bacterium]|nr:hypothetical protein [Burkholderiales bacterium]
MRPGKPIIALALAALARGGLAAQLEVSCAPERPVSAPGGELGLQAWVTDDGGKPLREALRISWAASSGSIVGEARSRWKLPGQAGRATARVTVEAAARGRATCELSVEVAGAPPPLPGVVTRGRLAARVLLVRGTDEPAGYGEYSYLLFASAPDDARQRELQLRAVESYLREVDALEQLADLRPPSQLNLTMLPVLRAVSLPARFQEPEAVRAAAERVLADFDYPRAKHLLDLLGKQAPRGGVALASRQTPAAGGDAPWLVMNLSMVSPQLAADWVRAFCWLSAQERGWGEAAGLRLGLGLRNALAVAADQLGEVLTDWPQLLLHGHSR